MTATVLPPSLARSVTAGLLILLLTRIGFGSKAVITGDQTQIDLPRGTQSGLVHALDVLQGVPGIGFTHFDSKDVVRHQLVQRIVEADIGTLDTYTARELHAMMVEICIHHCTATRPRCTQSGAARRFVDPAKCAEHCPPCSGCPVAHNCHYQVTTISLLG